ncbi:LLM class flavin-dependent oxidoreductase [Nocardia cyriacigeorgica]|uniref:LLM class flavin-dependent oxidoreductase n=1 Tax=Nocardia cyriacigeorgica TaxID=135487 RepID=UPI0018941B0D|nr:LLM class flavin-dependent oxidoreductase [Nocardia cyriacigeorgica]MBF6452932.1 LLM class flavin-dependent oxidoreductase [Nocardia cyriacigeorgica]MBF6478763.1 LLM class flavin-dependent oxidoreductase [Nocardia cyriacigeorgica]MBF6550101.1 LLM class flavin-dependent oxidoreductase [Nocardia cyriacigeorgica]
MSAPSLFVQLRSGPPAAEVYRHTIDIAVRAEQLGYRTIWFATRHFRAHHAALPSVFPFLTAVAQHTATIRLGAGVVSIPFEHPVRLAEDAVVTDALSGGRLELGVGKGLGFGLSASSWAGFGVPDSERESIYAERLTAVHRILDDGLVTDEVALYPPPGTLRSRMWQSTGNIDTARRAGAAGDGLLPHGNSQARAGGSVTELVDAYLEQCRGTPRIGSSVAVLPGASEHDSLDLLDTDIALSPAFYPELPGDSERRRYLADNRIHIGSAAQIVDELRADPGRAAATEVLFYVPLAVGHPRYGECLHRISTEIAPRLTTLPIR